MPIRRQAQSSRSKFTLSDSDSEDEICLTLTRYQEAELGGAFHSRQVATNATWLNSTSCEYSQLCRANFKRATEELTALVKQAYVQHADKTVQELIFEDVLSAIRQCSRSEKQLQSARSWPDLTQASKISSPLAESHFVQA